MAMEAFDMDLLHPEISDITGLDDLLSFKSPVEDSNAEMEWLDGFLDDSTPVLNDRMMTDAVPSPHIKSEHSYSMAEGRCSSAHLQHDRLIDLELHSDNLTAELDVDLPSFPPHLHGKIRRQVIAHGNRAPEMVIKQEPDSFNKHPTIVLTRGSQQMSVLHGNSAQRLVLPKLNIKVEKVDTEYNSALQPGFGLPPSPPSSSEDSEGGQSPNPSSMSAHDTRVQQLTSAVITNLSNLPASGPLYLSAEEKRTLVQEGYPVPTRLPLNKGEERSLKKIRRKIKNKISAQESRRKKKEYVDNLESKCETFSSENLELRKKVESLEHNNQSLLSQLQKLQVMVGRMTHSSKHVTTQTTGTCLMVLVLCFAVFFGSYSPSGVGFHHISALQSRSQVPMGADFNPDSADSGGGYGLNVYSTSSKRSRVLLSFHEENTEMACLADAFPSGRSKSDDVLQAQDTTATNNETGSSKGQSDEGSPSSGAPVKKSRDQLSGSLALSAEMRSKLNEVSVTIGASDLSTQVPTKVIAVDRVRNTTE